MATTESNQLAPVDRALMDVRKMLGANAKGLQALLGSYMPMERYCGAIMTLCRQNPDLLDQNKASRASLLLSVLRVAQLNLSPDPALGQAWIIPRQGRAEFQLGWKGCLALAYRHPLVAAVRYGVVGKADRFVWEDGRHWRLEHDPSPEGWPDELSGIVAAWAILELRTGGAVPRVMYLAEILRHKGRGKGSQPAWATDPAAMAVKTVLGDVCRRGPFEAEIGRAFNLDFSGEIGKGQPDDGTIEADFSVAEEGNGATPRGPLAKFKAARKPKPEEKVIEVSPASDARQAPEPPDGPGGTEVSDAGALTDAAEVDRRDSGGTRGETPEQARPEPDHIRASADPGASPNPEEWPDGVPTDPRPYFEAHPLTEEEIRYGQELATELIAEPPPRLSKAAKERIRDAAAQRGLDTVALSRLCGGRGLDEIPAAEETEILSRIMKAGTGRKR